MDESDDFPDGHHIGRLWSACRPLLLRVWPEESEAYASVEGVVDSLLQIDPEGEPFQYPLTSGRRRSNGRRMPTLDAELREMDLQRLLADVTAALDGSYGAEAEIVVHVEQRAGCLEEAGQIEAEYARRVRS